MKLYKILLEYGVAVVIANNHKEVIKTWTSSEYGYRKIHFRDIREIYGYTVEGKEARVIACYFE